MLAQHNQYQIASRNGAQKFGSVDPGVGKSAIATIYRKGKEQRSRKNSKLDSSQKYWKMFPCWRNPAGHRASPEFLQTALTCWSFGLLEENDGAWICRRRFACWSFELLEEIDCWNFEFFRWRHGCWSFERVPKFLFLRSQLLGMVGKHPTLCQSIWQ